MSWTTLSAWTVRFHSDIVAFVYTFCRAEALQPLVPKLGIRLPLVMLLLFFLLPQHGR